MRTNRASPRLASHAARVRSKINVVAFGNLLIIWFIGIDVARIRRAASTARRAVRRWVRCRKNAARVKRVARRSVVEGEKVIG
jgi:hypothetical protein